MAGCFKYLFSSILHLNGLQFISFPQFKETQVYLFAGAFLFVFIFSFVTAISSKRLDFLFYSLYSLCLLLYLGIDAWQIDEMFYAARPVLYLWVYSILQILINLFYVVFAKHYLETFDNYPKLDKAINIIVGVLVFFIIAEAFLNFSLLHDSHLLLMNIHRLVMSVFGILAFIYLLKFAKDALAYFIVIGSCAFLAGALAMLFSEDKSYMMAGSALEVLLFGFGLNYKLKKANEEKIRLKQVANDNKISALRAQMNPHFIFNSLGSIQHLILSNKKEPAVKYLNKFSLLMRNLLEGSIGAKLVLAEEISLLEKYIELEALRFDNAFYCNITVDKNLDPQELEIPALIIQPFVENAILHGLLNKKSGGKKLRIHFYKKKNFLICEVEDNGMGRKQAEKIKTPLKKSRKSRGIEVTEKRLEIINGSEKSPVKIIDKTDENGKPTGTLVIIEIAVEQT